MTLLEIPVGAGERLAADLDGPVDRRGVVVFAHGSGSSRHSPRNRAVAHRLHQVGLATLLVDLLTEAEDQTEHDGRVRFDIGLLAARLEQAIATLAKEIPAQPLGLFGASTGAAAALVVASRLALVRAVVSRGGRPDLAGAALARVRAPTLLIVGSADSHVIAFNHDAQQRLAGPSELRIVDGATHLFE